MQIVINHLTRMQPGIFCVAGIDLQTGLHIRPVMGRHLEVGLLAREGGIFELGRVIDLGNVTFAGSVPEVEDHRFDSDQLKLVEQWPMSQLIQFCHRFTRTTLSSIFGPALKPVAREAYHLTTATVPAHEGLRSLGLLVTDRADLNLIENTSPARLRLTFTDEGRKYSVAVTDIRLWQRDHRTPNREQIANFQQILSDSSIPILLSVGLSRVYRPTSESEPKHWLQVNNILLP